MKNNTQETEQNKNIHPILKKIRDSWNSPIVLRKEIEKFSCGLVNSKSMQTLDSVGKGIQKSVKINGKIAYMKDDVVEWLQSRLKKEESIRKHSHKNDIFLR